jgi:hypothetical protein
MDTTVTDKQRRTRAGFSTGRHSVTKVIIPIKLILIKISEDLSRKADMLIVRSIQKTYRSQENKKGSLPSQTMKT